MSLLTDATRQIRSADLNALEVRLIRPVERPGWDQLMSRYHYLGFRAVVGESLKYIATLDGQWVALMGWGAAAFKNKARDKWIGWEPEVQWKRLKYIANNVRFLVLPWARRENLASKVLSLNLKRLSGDWEHIHGHRIVMVETFVDHSRFKGTCYLAAGWKALGQTKGYGRNAGRYYFHGGSKTIFVRTLSRNALRFLSDPFYFESRGGKEVFVDLNKANLEGHNGLLVRLARIKDPRKPRGIRHTKASILATAVCACLSGCRGFAAIAEWANDLPQKLLKRLGCRFCMRRRKRIAPSEPTIRRVLQSINADEVDEEVNEWLAEEVDGNAIAVDGKTLRGSGSRESKAVHLMAALLHTEGIVLSQRQVDEKSNEITALQPLLDPLDLTDKVVTADAMHAQTEHATYIKKRGAITSS